MNKNLVTFFFCFKFLKDPKWFHLISFICAVFSVTTGKVIKAAELEKGEVNNSSEFWIKPGKSHAIPVVIDKQNTVLCWEFTSQPKVCMTSFFIVIFDF